VIVSEKGEEAALACAMINMQEDSW
jgi:hypothetical protein